MAGLAKGYDIPRFQVGKHDSFTVVAVHSFQMAGLAKGYVIPRLGDEQA